MTFQSTVDSQTSLDSIYQPVQYIESKSHPGEFHEVRCLLNSGVWTCSNCPAFDKLLINPEAKVIVVTGYTDYEFDRDEADAIFNKPYDPEKLIAEIEKLCS